MIRNAAYMSQKKKISKQPEQKLLSKSTTLKFQHYSAPLPISSEYRGYDEVLPGSANRIMSMAEKEQSHSFGIENREQLLYYAAKFTGQTLVACVSLAVVFSGVYLIVNGHDIVGMGAIVGSLAVYAGTVIYGKK